MLNKLITTKAGFICPHCLIEQDKLGEEILCVEFTTHYLAQHESDVEETEYDLLDNGYKVEKIPKNKSPYYCLDCSKSISEEIGNEIIEFFKESKC